MKPCPFCGLIPQLDDGDTLYPTGIGWDEPPELDGLRVYVPAIRLPKNQWCYKLICHCCGVEMHGDSKQEVLDKWECRST